MLIKSKGIRMIRKENYYNMVYEEFILDIICGHEFIGTIDNKIFKILNFYDEYYTIKIGNEKYNISKDEDIEEIIIYKNMTLKELINNNLIKITESY